MAMAHDKEDDRDMQAQLDAAKALAALAGALETDVSDSRSRRHRSTAVPGFLDAGMPTDRRKHARDVEQTVDMLVISGSAEVHSIGSSVMFWSKTRGKWVNAIIRALCRNDEGKLISYDLDLQVEVGTGFVCRPGAPHDVHTGVVPASSISFALGDHVWYWSSTYAKWVEALVKDVVRDSKGGIARYVLAAKMTIDAARVRPISLGGPAASKDDQRTLLPTVKPGARSSGAVASTQSERAFEIGDRVQYKSDKTGKWVDAIVEQRYKRQGAYMYYDLDCKKGARRERIRLSPSSFQAGDAVEYWSDSGRQWLKAKLLEIDASRGRCDLNIKKGAPLAKIRKANYSRLEVPQPLQPVSATTVPEGRAGGAEDALFQRLAERDQLRAKEDVDVLMAMQAEALAAVGVADDEEAKAMNQARQEGGRLRRWRTWKDDASRKEGGQGAASSSAVPTPDPVVDPGGVFELKAKARPKRPLPQPPPRGDRAANGKTNLSAPLAVADLARVGRVGQSRDADGEQMPPSSDPRWVMKRDRETKMHDHQQDDTAKHRVTVDGYGSPPAKRRKRRRKNREQLATGESPGSADLAALKREGKVRPS